MADKPEIIGTNKARAGSTPHIVRYVLAASLILVVVGMIWAYVAAPSGTQEGATTGPESATTNPAYTAPEASAATPPPSATGSGTR